MPVVRVVILPTDTWPHHYDVAGERLPFKLWKSHPLKHTLASRRAGCSSDFEDAASEDVESG